ncbi:hypothetical protein U27_03108 [Candidatus Vecturithrix granuli]|uniref:B3/B4 tRNA-binding domain-containing protein n=1 Tax=Vecturithrix granuli TaxID=1499967 RepID=A0A081BUZ1_VECG1|nr:hypothetical protein U27_03108 [Candidatus Vecturithrix granuli]
MLTISNTWKITYPDAFVGLLAMEKVVNPQRHPELEARKTDIEAQLRSQFANLERADLKALPILQAYNAYYKQFKKSYHVQAQVESVVWKGKTIPSVAALVEAMFMAELKNMLLTAGHDLEKLQLPVKIDVAAGDEQYLKMNGQEQMLKAGDMYIADGQGILSSILYGPDRRTQISPATSKVLFTIYAPPGIESQTVRQHLEDIRDYVHIVAPQAEVTLLEVYGTR